MLEAVHAVAEDLANTPAICRKSYVHGSVVAAFEDGVLERFAQTLAGCRSQSRRAQVLAQIIAAGMQEQFSILTIRAHVMAGLVPAMTERPIL